MKLSSSEHGPLWDIEFNEVLDFRKIGQKTIPLMQANTVSTDVQLLLLLLLLLLLMSQLLQLIQLKLLLMLQANVSGV